MAESASHRVGRKKFRWPCGSGALLVATTVNEVNEERLITGNAMLMSVFVNRDAMTRVETSQAK